MVGKLLLFVHVCLTTVTVDARVYNINGCGFSTHYDIDENVTVGFQFLKISGVKNLAFKGNKPPAEFQISHGSMSDSWILKTMSKLDHEQKTDIRFTISCTGTDLGSADYSVTVNVIDVVDVKVSFTDAPYNISIPEDTSSPKVIKTIHFQSDTTTGNIICEVKGNSKFNAKTCAPFGSSPNWIMEVQLTSQMDYGTDDHIIKLQIIVEIPGHLNLSTSSTLVVNLIDVDNLNPAFTQPSYIVKVPENKPPNSLISMNPPILAVDQDTGINATIKYRLQSGQFFNISGDDGSLTLIEKLDRENQSDVTLVVMAFQENNPNFRQVVAVVMVTVTDVNDNRPKMSNDLYNVTIPENMKNGQIVTQVEATDADEGKNSNFYYYMNDTSGAFKMDPKTGHVIVKNSIILDKEKNDSLIMQVYAEEINTTEHWRSNMSTITIYLTDVNDNNPVFTSNATYTFTVAKNLPNGSHVGKVSASDADKDSTTNGMVTYSFSGPPEVTKHFHIDNHTGSITLHSDLYTNYTKQLEMEVIATDSPVNKEEQRKSIARLTVMVTDVNMNPPTLHPAGPRTITLQEDISINYTFVPFTANDKDPDDVPKLAFTLLDTTDTFRINSSSGELKLMTELDRESKDLYNMTVTVNDTSRTASASLIIKVDDVNDNNPRFNQTVYYSSVKEEESHVSLDVEVMVTDEDQGVNSQISYSIEDTWNSTFSITNNGTIHLIKAIDRETMGKSNVTDVVVIATDKGNPPRSGSAVVKVSVVDINDNVPMFSETNPINITLQELQEPKPFYTVKASDVDCDDQVLYHLNSPTDIFQINPTTGKLSNTKELKMEDSSDGIFILEIEAYNQREYVNETMENSTQKLTILIQDVNNHAPIFNSSNYQMVIPEDFRTGDVIGRVTASDKDTDPSYNTVYYWISDGDDQHHFYIDNVNGSLYLASPLDYENTTKFQLTISASDSVTMIQSSHTVNATFTVSISDVNDNSPYFLQDTYVCQVQENKTGVFNCLFDAKDNDVTPHYNEFEYKITSPDDALFEVIQSTNSTGGELNLSNKIDYDSGNHSFTITVEAIDRNNSLLNGSCQIFVEIININDERPVFTQHHYDFLLGENEPVNTIVGEVFANDPDSQGLNYKLQGSSDFEVNITNGIIVSNKIFDYEALRSEHFIIKFNITVSDGSQTDQCTVSVEILNMNDNSPVFINPTYRVKIFENTTTENILNVTATDEDNIGNITYSLQNETLASLFTIDSETGAIYFNGSLDFENRTYYILQVLADDGSCPPLVGEAVVEILVLDVDDSCPHFIQDFYTASVSENQTATVNITEVFADDVDTDINALVYNVINNTEFKFVHHTLTTNTTLDCDEGSTSHTLIISVSDGICNSSTATVTINVTDINDNPPVFTNRSLKTVIPQNTTKGEHIYTVNATDKDVSNKGFTYFFPESNGIFEINAGSGELFVLTNETLKPNTTHVLLISVSDHGSPPLFGNMTLSVFVNASNHFKPFFENESITVSVQENQNALVSVVNMTAIDRDTGKEGEVIYRITEGETDKFQINNETGEITLKTILNCEEKKEYVLKVVVQDQGFNPMSSTGTVTINVQNVPEAPQFMNINQGICVNPPLNASSVVATIGAYDDDVKCTGNENDKVIYYSLLNHTDLFEITAHGGLIKTKQTIKDDTFDYSLTVMITDNSNLSATKTFQIASGKKGEPIIKPSVLILNFKEENKENATLTQINATSTGKGQITYSLETYVKDVFEINKTTGVISVLRSLNRERDSEDIIVVVKASNLNGTCQSQVHIHLLDINNNAPIFTETEPNYIFLPEDKNVPSLCIHNISVTDPDENSNLKIELSGNNSDGHFNLTQESNTTACINLIKPLDADTKPVVEYILQVVVNDGLHNATKNLTVEVKDINDNDPFFNETSYNFTISESFPLQQTFAHVVAEDKDTTDIHLLRYSINSSGLPFTINSINGAIQLTSNLNRENTSLYTFYVTVRDSSNKTNSTVVNIEVTDINDNPPIFTEHYNFTLDEGPTSENFMINISATDEDDGENGTVYFNITKGGNDGQFLMHSNGNNKASITIKRELDHEAKGIQILKNGLALYTLEIAAKDHGFPQQSSTATVYLYVKDINDCQPVFDQTPMEAQLMEGSTIGFPVYTVTASDCDYEPQNRNLSFSLSGSDQDFFTITKEEHQSKINVEFGIIKLNKTIDGRKEFHLNITVSDGKYSNNSVLHITVNDVNNHDPVFNETIYNFSTPENDDNETVLPTWIGQVSATDVDLGKNGNVSYKIISMDVKNLFIISEVNGSIYVNGTLDRDQCISNRYTFTVIAEDEGTSKRTGYTEVVVSITDINDNKPVFQPPGVVYKGTVLENSLNNKEVQMNHQIYATDIDNLDNGTQGIRFSIISEEFLPFGVNETTGTIFVSNSTHLDRETQALYEFQIFATDEVGSGLRTVSNVTITVLDTNDNPPYFINESSYKFYVYENETAPYTVGSVMANDIDKTGNSTLRYRITSGAEERFVIDRITGEIQVSKGLDRETKSTYTLNVTVFDGKFRNYTLVYIYINDTNDNRPQFPNSVFHESVPEEMTVLPSLIVQLNATDEDTGVNSQIKYSINETMSNTTSGIFFVAMNGSLYLNKSLDRENIDHYTLYVCAMDSGNPPLSSTAVVHVNVEDTNDHSPIFYNLEHHKIHNITVSVLEKSPLHSLIYLPTTVDLDTGENGQVTYEMHSENPKIDQFFDINKEYGIVSIMSPISVNSLVNITKGSNQNDSVLLTYIITASDHGTPAKSSNLTMYVLVEGINDDSPVFLQQLYNFTVPENATQDTEVGTVQAVVYNESFYHLTYSMIQQSDAHSYFYVHPLKGEITTSGALNRENEEKLTFAVQVVDGRIPERTAFTVINIEITDINDNPPVFDHSGLYSYSVVENDSSPAPLYLRASDTDIGENAEISFFILDDTDKTFRVNETSGEFNIQGSLDRENKSHYIIPIKAVDHGKPQLSSVVNITVTVLDINDNTPTFTNHSSSVTVPENRGNNSMILATINAEDLDEGLNGTIVYKLLTDEDPFQIDLSGNIWCTQSLDYETTPNYTLTIIALDLGKPQKSSNTTLTVYVEDLADDMPVFNQTLYEINIFANTTVGSIVHRLNAGQNVMYRIKDGNRENRFKMDSSTGDIKLHTKLAVDVTEYLMSVEAVNSASNLTASTKVLIHVLGLNKEFSPKTIYSASVVENKNGSMIIDLNTTDEESGRSVEYHIVKVLPPNGISGFNISQSNGQVFCIKSFDREKNQQYTLHINVTTNHRQRSKRASEPKASGDSPKEIILTVNVKDVNDNPPSFAADKGKFVFGVAASAKIGDVVGIINAVDPDTLSKGRVKYNITSGEMEKFYMYPSNGQIVVKQNIYNDPQTNFSMVVMATDEDGLSDSADVLILVVPRSDSMMLVVPVSSQKLQEHENSIKTINRHISGILGFNFEIEKYMVHTENNKLDPCKTDLYFHGVDNETNAVISKDEAQKVVTKKIKEITEFFCVHLNDSTVSLTCDTCNDVSIIAVPVQHPKVISDAEIALIVIGAVILVGTFLTIVLLLPSSARHKKDEESADKGTGNVEMFELESCHGGSIRGPSAGITNPAYTVETKIDEESQRNSSSDLGDDTSQNSIENEIPRQRSISFESQEVMLDFLHEDGKNGAADVSIADSGVENESDSSNTGSLQAENIAEEEGQRNKKTVTFLINDDQQVGSSGHEQQVINIDMETGDTDDENFSDVSSDEFGNEEEDMEKSYSPQIKDQDPTNNSDGDSSHSSDISTNLETEAEVNEEEEVTSF